MRIVRVSLFVLMVAIFVFAGLAPQKIFAGRKATAFARPHSSRAFTAKNQAARNRRLTDSAQGNLHTMMLSGTGAAAASAPTVVSITVSPNPELLTVGGTIQFTAIGVFSDNSVQDLTSTATWSSSNTTIATVSAAGLATGVKVGGAVTIQAAQAGIVGSASLTVTSAFTGPYQLGQLFASLGNGLVGVFKSDGTLLGTINTGQTLNAGLAFDATGNLYVTTFSTPTGIVKIDTNGKLVGPFGSGYSGNPESIVFSHAGDAIVGEAQPSDPTNPAPVPVLELDASGNPIATFNVARQDRGSDWVELLQDQKTLFYTSEGTSVKSFDISTSQQNADFASNLPGSSAYALRQLPDGTLLVADSTAALRLTSAGVIQTTYTPNPAAQDLFALNLDPDDTSFWTADLSTGVIYRFDIASGNQLTTFTAPASIVSGLAVFGEKPPGQNNVTVTENGSGSGTVSSQPAGINCPTVCVAPFTDNSPVMLTASPAQGSSFGGFSSNCTPSNPQTNPPSCTVSLATTDVTVTVTFSSGTGGSLLNVVTAGTGMGTVMGAGIDCTTGSASGCMTNVAAGTQMTLTAMAATGSTFTSWSAICPNMTSTTCTFTMPATGQMVTATFTLSGPTLKSIKVTPATATIGINATQQFTATGTFSDNSTKDVTGQSTWTSSAPATATVGAATGLATGVAAGGPVTITATDGTITGTAQLTVSSGPTLKSIAVTPSTANIGVNGMQPFTATGTFSDNSTKDVTTQSAWTSSNTEVATVGAGTGIAKGVGVGGPVTITATDAGISGTAQLTVSNVPFTLTINPPPGGVFGPVAPGGTLPVGVILTALPGTTGTVTFGCTTSSPTITCSPQPSSVALSPNGPLQVAIVVNTFCKGPVTTGHVVPPGGFGGGIGLLLLSMMLGGTAWVYRRNPRWAVSFALFVLIALGGVACNSLPRNPNGVTLPGNYQLFITATFNGQTVTAPAVNFVVN